MANYKLILPVFFILSAMLSLYGIYLFISTLSFRKNSVKVVGNVIEVKSRTNKNKQVIYAPVIAFKTEDGKEVRFESFSYKHTKNEVGDQMNILYDINNPSNAKTDDFRAIWGGTFLFLAIGLLGVIICGVLYRK